MGHGAAGQTLLATAQARRAEPSQVRVTVLIMPPGNYGRYDAPGGVSNGTVYALCRVEISIIVSGAAQRFPPNVRAMGSQPILSYTVLTGRLLFFVLINEVSQ